MNSWNKVTGSGAFDLQDAVDNWGSDIDPYLVWAFASRFEYVQSPELLDDNGMPLEIPVVIELADGVSVTDIVNETVSTVDTGDGALQGILTVSDLYRNVPIALEDVRFLTAQVRIPAFFEELKTGGFLYSKVKRFELGLAVESRSTRLLYSTNLLRSARFDQQRIQLSLPDVSMIDSGVNLAIIDDGISFLNNDLRRDGAIENTRIKYFWNQNKIGDSVDARLQANWPIDFTIGHFHNDYLMLNGWQISDTQINSWLVRLNTDEVSEHAIYSAYQYWPLHHSISHGTHILGVASGYENSLDAGAAASTVNSKLNAVDIVGVQVASTNRRFNDTSGRWFSYHLLDAIRYCLLRGDDLAVQEATVQGNVTAEVKPMVVNISIGNMAGPHDGSSILESAIDEMHLLRNSFLDSGAGGRTNNSLEFVLSAGNQKLARSHAELTIQSGGSEALTWRALPDDATPNFMEIWLPESHSDTQSCENITIHIEPPYGQNPSGPITCGDTYELKRNDVVECVVVYLPPDKMATGKNGMMLLALAPTNKVLNDKTVQPGDWTVTVENLNEEDLTIKAWIQRDDSVFNRPTLGRQSRFDDPNFARFLSSGYPRKDDVGNESYIRLEGTISAIATGENSIAAGSFRYSDDEDADYSGQGDATIKRTNTLAVADDSVTCRGVISSGSMSGSKAALDGTSVAAAQVSRKIITTGEYTVKKDRLVLSDVDILSKNRRIGRKRKHTS